jgi:NADPH-dependent glutamate synthase beta subunit-like oxidoreductase
MSSTQGLVNPILHPFIFLFQIFQWLTDKLLSPKPPGENARLGHNRPKIAVIGAGITGVTSAAHCIGHGFDVVIFEAGTKDNVGGIWSVSYSPDLYLVKANISIESQ